MPLEDQHLGRYRLLRLLGSGGMGEVYLAEDARIGQQVAIKVIRAEGIAYPQSQSAKEAARLFEREAKAIARLDHPNILPLYAYGEETLNDTLLSYLVMPYRKEGTLASWLRLRGEAAPLSPSEVTPLLQQAADALQHAHHQHVIHQDIKPTNFLIRLRADQPERPDLLLADFGIAKLTSATSSASQSIRGTPTYMAPEQWEGHPVPASDQYALAIMVYDLLVGRPPFVGGPGQVMRQHYLTPPAAPSSINPHLSPAIDAVLLRALAKQPEGRFPSVAAFARAFQEALQRSGELHATLAISRAEAESGTTRTLTLPGGRQVSVTVPAGVSDGTTLRLEGQGMPYYQGGPAGPLVLAISIPVQASPLLPLQQDSMEPTVAVSMPNAELPAVEDPRVPPAPPEASGELEPTVPAPHESESAPSVLATDSPTPPTELATPARHTSLPAEMARSATPPAVRPDAMIAAKPHTHLSQPAEVEPVTTPPGEQGAASESHDWQERARRLVGAGIRQALVAMALGVILYGALNCYLDLLYKNNDPLALTGVPVLNVSIDGGIILAGVILIIPLFLATISGPLVGIVTVMLGLSLGSFLAGYDAAGYYGASWTLFVGHMLIGFIAGLAVFLTRGRYNTARTIVIAVALSAVAIVIGTAFTIYADIPGISASSCYQYGVCWTWFTRLALPSTIALVVLPILLLAYNAIVDRRNPA